jgi:hypothetical protein
VIGHLVTGYGLGFMGSDGVDSAIAPIFHSKNISFAISLTECLHSGVSAKCLFSTDVIFRVALARFSVILSRPFQ